MKSAVIYARLSDVRKGDTEGIDRQIREGEAHAERLGLTVVERLIDNDLSAAKRKRRPAYDELMAGIANGKWDAVVLRSLDRWVRRPAELEQIIEVVDKSPVKVEAIHGEIDLRTRGGRLQARVVTAVAMNEVDATTERVTDWHADRAARGLPCSGLAGYGFGDDKVTLNAAEAKRIREAAKRVLNGESLLSIVRRWNDAGVPFHDDAPWTPGALRRVLLAPRIAGLRTHLGELTDAVWPAIVDRDTFDQVGRILTSPSRRSSTGPRTQRLLTGLLSCGVGLEKGDDRARCGKPLNAKTSQKGQRYYCRHCLGTLVASDHVEDFVKGAVIEALDRADLVAAVKRLRKETDRADEIGKIAMIERDMETLAHELGEDRLTMPEFKAARSGMEKRLSALRASVEKQTDLTPLTRWAGKGGALAAAWPRLGHDDKRAIIAAVFDDIVIRPARAGFNRFDAERIRLVPSALVKPPTRSRARG